MKLQYHWSNYLRLLHVDCFASCQIDVTTDSAVSKSKRTSGTLSYVM